MNLNQWIMFGLLSVSILFFLSWQRHRPLKTTEKKQNGAVSYRSLSPQDGWAILQKKQKVTVLDVRTPDEYHYSHLPDSINLPVNKLESKAKQTLGHRNHTILIYCQSGSRSKQATKILYAMGYTHVYDIGGLATFYKQRPQTQKTP